MSARFVVPAEDIQRSILRLRGHNVMLDEDLAALYQVDVKVLNQAVKRNQPRFPPDFMFRLTAREVASLRSQTVTLNGGRGRHRKYPPSAFTEQGVAMLSGVLRSPRAVRVNIAIMRAFVRLRQVLAANADLAKKLYRLETKYDAQFDVVFEAIRELMAPPKVTRKRIGFMSHQA
jgi:hypothetical protein